MLPAQHQAVTSARDYIMGVPAAHMQVGLVGHLPHLAGRIILVWSYVACDDWIGESSPCDKECTVNQRDGG